MGYCPQFDALFETLTAREHLALYASIKACAVPFPPHPFVIPLPIFHLTLPLYGPHPHHP